MCSRNFSSYITPLFFKLNHCCHWWFSDLGGEDKQDYALVRLDMSYEPFHGPDPVYFPKLHLSTLLLTLYIPVMLNVFIFPKLATFFSTLAGRLFPLLTLPGCLQVLFPVQSALLYVQNVRMLRAHYTMPFYKGLVYQWILVSAGGPGTNPSRNQGTTAFAQIPLSSRSLSGLG